MHPRSSDGAGRERRRVAHSRRRQRAVEFLPPVGDIAGGAVEIEKRVGVMAEVAELREQDRELRADGLVEIACDDHRTFAALGICGEDPTKL